MKKSCLIIGTLLWGMSAFAQTTIWKRSWMGMSYFG